MYINICFSIISIYILCYSFCKDKTLASRIDRENSESYFVISDQLCTSIHGLLIGTASLRHLVFCVKCGNIKNEKIFLD